jgi:hypothetical protein
MRLPMSDWIRVAGVGALSCGLLPLAGCESIELALGMRMRLDKVSVTALSASLIPETGLAPGQSGRLIIVATTADGHSFVTAGAGHGKVLFDSFAMTGSAVQVSKKGKVSLSSDPRVSDGAVPRIGISVNGQPSAVAELKIPVRYDVAFAAHFSGRAGFDGFNGSDGQSGSSGSMGSLDPNNPSPGGNGGSGTDGGAGNDGGPGQPGQSVHVWITLRAGLQPLLQVRAAGTDREQLFLIDPTGGSCAIDANGGPGGRGGAGGRGGSGGSGGIGSPNGSTGLSGLDGRRGWDGRGGAAGTIFVSVDPSAQLFLDHFTFSSKSGDGFPAAPPIVEIESVGALW